MYSSFYAKTPVWVKIGKPISVQNNNNYIFSYFLLLLLLLFLLLKRTSAATSITVLRPLSMLLTCLSRLHPFFKVYLAKKHWSSNHTKKTFNQVSIYVSSKAFPQMSTKKCATYIHILKFERTKFALLTITDN